MYSDPANHNNGINALNGFNGLNNLNGCNVLNGPDEAELKEAELKEAEMMIRGGADARHIARKQFTYLGQSDIFKLYRKFGLDMNDSDDMW